MFRGSFVLHVWIGFFATLEGLVSPHVARVTVTSTVGDTKIVKITVDCFERSRTFEAQIRFCVLE